jgi:hypothetical protein
MPAPSGYKVIHTEIAKTTPKADTTPIIVKVKVPLDKNTRILAATAYGEGSIKNVFEEMAAIANVLVRQQKARGYSDVEVFIRTDRGFAYAAHDGNKRFGKLMAASEKEIKNDEGMNLAVKAAKNALSANPQDYSKGAYFWDGADIKSNYDLHEKVQRGGIHITDPSHNIYKIENKDVPGEDWWRDEKKNRIKLRGKWNYKYESTTALGGTIFWKYNADFLKGSGNKEYD